MGLSEMLADLYYDFRKLVKSWWQSDRIRVSPRDGRFLRIQPGDLLTIGTTHVEVLERSIVLEPTGRSLHLNCRSESGSAVLCVTITADERLPKVVWSDSGRRRELAVDDVQVWSRAVPSPY